MKSIHFSIYLLTGILAAGCSKSSDVSTEARVTDVTPKTEVSTDATSLEIEAVTYERRQAFSEAMRKRLAVIESEIQSLEAVLEESSDSAKSTAQPKIASLKSQAADLKDRIQAIGDATPTTWEGVKADSQKAYDALQQSVNDSRQWLSDLIQPDREN
ncbi:hypothetical protein [Pelagicoccus sp. SDUM812003]|uniref:hypothetical protein n=1 Tax=Pelagicoccus sp. SDUM812003 TaxID=3041267 RepID=UPI00280D6E6A|nr:hypothetical protein [Pelagicoccus sp. SDUM812003]MDQ8204305.1 hypothetical protein [Pelagicoccus sp. SDUM812003]